MKQMKQRILFLTDPHIHNYSEFDQKGSRLNNCIKLMREVIEKAKAEGIDTIVCGGDLFDKATLSAVVVNAVAKVVNEIPEGMRFLTISGNHDMYSTPRFGEEKGTAVTYLAELCPRFEVIDDRSEYIHPLRTRIYGIPYYDHKGEYAQALDLAVQDAQELGEQDFKLLVIHQTPEGLDNKMIQTDTDPNDPRYDVFDLVLCGHIHTQKFITDKFVVAGTPLHRTMEDAGEEKGYFIVNVGHKAKNKPAKELLEFVSTRGRYPEFRVTDEPKDVPRYPHDFVKVRPKEVVFKTKAASVKDFGSGVKPSDMVEAYWKEVGGGDELLLKVGIKLLQE